MTDNEGKNTKHTHRIFKKYTLLFHGNAPSYYIVHTNTLAVLFCTYFFFVFRLLFL